MAAQVDTRSSPEGKSGDGGNDLPIFNVENLQNNMKSIYYSRTFLSIMGGVIAGIWGFTGLTGFVFYLLIMGVTSLGLLAKAKFSVGNYFDSWNRIMLDGFFGGLMAPFGTVAAVMNAVVKPSFMNAHQRNFIHLNIKVDEVP